MTPRTALLDGVHVTHAGAATECEARGLRLCSRAELQQCCKMGCGLDKHLTCRNQGSSDSASWRAGGSCPRQLVPWVKGMRVLAWTFQGDAERCRAVAALHKNARREDDKRTPVG